MPFHIYTYENPEVINSNIVLKHILKKKYDWVIDVNLVFVTVRESKNSRDFNEVVLDGVIKVDEDWYEKNWPEYKKYGPVPKPNDSYVVLGELLMGKSAIEFNSECRKALTLSLKKQIDGVIWSDLVVKTEEIKKEDITESIRRILREEINLVLRKVMRRIAAIDWEIEFAVREVKRQNNVCFMGEDAFIETVIEKTIDSMYWDFFSDIDDNSKEWTSAYYFMEQYINDNFVDKLRQNYQLNCNKQVETNESELTEKCWAGYTQKGMKTMFGKRYPNCVKKTKK
jgi:hypothetical protein